MPLHLLGKKSWNVYNADNIARVRRDEADAKAAEEAEEQRMQEVDAQRRLAILRGEAPPPLPQDDEPAKDEDGPGYRPAYASSMRKKRKRVGEDDTDYELRLAKERTDAAYGAGVAQLPRKLMSSAPLVDQAGHINLFGDERTRAHAEKNEEAEAEAKKKQRDYEDQYTMRFSNAAGKDGITKPWYSHSDGVAPDSSSKDVWGNEDPNRRKRDTRRIISDDPLAMMKKGASQVRDLKKERQRIQEERDEDLKQLRRERHRERHRRRDDGHRAHSHRRDSERLHSNEDQDTGNRHDRHRERRNSIEDERRRRRRHYSRSRSRSPKRSYRNGSQERR